MHRLRTRIWFAGHRSPRGVPKRLSRKDAAKALAADPAAVDVALIDLDNVKVIDDDLAADLNGHGLPEADAPGEPIVDDSFRLLFNAAPETAEFTLPDRGYGQMPEAVIDTADPLLALANDRGSVKAQQSLPVPAHTLLVLGCRVPAVSRAPSPPTGSLRRGYHPPMTLNDVEPRGSGRAPVGTPPADTSSHPEQVHPEQEAHGGSMAPGLVDDAGHVVDEGPPAAAGE